MRPASLLLGLALIAGCSGSSDDVPFEEIGSFAVPDSGLQPPPGAAGHLVFRPEVGRKTLWVRSLAGSLDRPSLSGMSWVQGTLQDNVLEVRDLYSFGVDREAQLLSKGQLGSVTFFDLEVHGSCDHMPRVPPEPCNPRLGAELKLANSGKSPVEVTLERAFVSSAGGIGTAVKDFAVNCDRGNGSPIALGPGEEKRAFIALPKGLGQGHGTKGSVTVVFSVGTDRLTLRAEGEIKFAE
jgi:hypothetical protein